MGRPSSYTPELGDLILNGLIAGESMRKLCAPEDMPDRGTVVRWLAEHPDFAAKYAHAREAQADTMDDMILEEAEKVTPETAAAARVKIDAYKWRAAKLKPKVYGDKIQHADADGGKLETPVVTVTLVRPGAE